MSARSWYTVNKHLTENGFYIFFCKFVLSYCSEVSSWKAMQAMSLPVKNIKIMLVKFPRMFSWIWIWILCIFLYNTNTCQMSNQLPRNLINFHFEKTKPRNKLHVLKALGFAKLFSLITPFHSSLLHFKAFLETRRLEFKDGRIWMNLWITEIHSPTGFS